MAGLVLIAFTTATLVLEVLLWMAVVLLTDTLTRLWVEVVWVLTYRWVLTLAVTCVVIEVLSIATLLDIVAFTFAR